jgi:fluoride ion exporter CrcB/FEX
MAMEGVRLLDQGQPALAASYWVTTLLTGQMAGVYGMWLGTPTAAKEATCN